MQTDELRAELAELAREVDAFPEDLGAVRRRVARRRVASASVALVIVAGLVAGGVALTRPTGHKLVVAGHPKSTTIAKLPRVDALVGLPAHSTTADIAVVEQILDSTAAVEGYARIPRRFFASNSDQGDFLVSPDLKVFASSVTFGVELDRSDPTRERQLTAEIGTAALVHDWHSIVGLKPGDDVEIFMDVKASRAQIEALNVAVRQDPDVASYTFVTKQDAYREFKRLFSDQPALVRNTAAKALPASFRISVRDGAEPSIVAARYGHAPAVDTVINYANPFSGN